MELISIPFECPGCRAILSIPENYQGKGKCRFCGQAFNVPPSTPTPTRFIPSASHVEVAQKLTDLPNFLPVRKKVEIPSGHFEFGSYIDKKGRHVVQYMSCFDGCIFLVICGIPLLLLLVFFIASFYKPYYEN